MNPELHVVREDAAEEKRKKRKAVRALREETLCQAQRDNEAVLPAISARSVF
jgi:hypothetical protein